MVTLLVPKKRLRIQVILSRHQTPWQLVNSFDLDFVKGYRLWNISNGQIVDHGNWLLPECAWSWHSKQVHSGSLDLKSYRLAKAEEQGFCIDLHFKQSAQFVWTPLNKSTKRNLAEITLDTKPLRQVTDSNDGTYEWFFPSRSMSTQQIQFVFQRVMPDCELCFSVEDLVQFLDGGTAFSQRVIGQNLSEYVAPPLTPLLAFPPQERVTKRIHLECPSVPQKENLINWSQGIKTTWRPKTLDYRYPRVSIDNGPELVIEGTVFHFFDEKDSKETPLVSLALNKDTAPFESLQVIHNTMVENIKSEQRQHIMEATKQVIPTWRSAWTESKQQPSQECYLKCGTRAKVVSYLNGTPQVIQRFVSAKPLSNPTNKRYNNKMTECLRGYGIVRGTFTHTLVRDIDKDNFVCQLKFTAKEIHWFRDMKQAISLGASAHKLQIKFMTIE